MLLRSINVFLLVALLFSAPAWGETFFEAGERFIRQGNDTEARRALENEIAVRPNNLVARYNLAVLFTRIEHEEEAIKLYEDNVSRGWHLPTVVNLSGLYRLQGKHTEAEALLKREAKKHRSEAPLWYLQAEIVLERGDRKLGKALLKKAVRADPLNGFAQLRYALFLSEEKQHRLALKHGARAARLLDDCAPCWKSWGDIQHAAGDFAGAVEAYQRSLAIDPNESVRKQLVEMLEAIGSKTRAGHIQKGMQSANN